MNRSTLALLCWVLSGLILPSLPALAQTTLRPLPPLMRSISDEVGVLSMMEGLALSRLIEDTRIRKKAEIIVLIAETTQPESVDAYITRLLKAWRANTDRLNRGRFVFVVIAKDERILRVVPGAKLVSVLKSFEQSNAIAESQTQLKQEKYFEGLEIIVQQLSQLIPDTANRV